MKKFFLALMMLLTCFGAASCSSFVDGSGDSLIIKNVSQQVGKNEKGEEGFYIIIEYLDDIKSPDKFFVPNGKHGEIGLTGNGIKNITSNVDETTKETTVLITFTDENMEPVQYVVPIGVSITGVTTNGDEEGNTTCVVNFSDGSTSEPFDLPKGEKGDGFEKYECNDNKEDGSKDLVFYFENHEPINVHIPGPEKGEQGIGIEAITSTTVNGEYIINIRLTGEEIGKDFKFKAPNTWLKGSGKPYDGKGNNGDFFFDVEYKIIYTKENDTWVEVVRLKEESTLPYTVTFDLNDPDEIAYLPDDYTKTINIKPGTYFGQNGKKQLPVPYKDNYTFEGWYLSQDGPSAVNGRFTDVTPVYSDLTLYAHWVPQNK